jgi:hypothetical protein
MASVFLSARFGPAGAEKEVIWLLRTQLEARGVTVYPSANPGNLDRQADIANGIKLADLFALLAQSHNGENTGNPMCSYEEFTFAKALGKPMAWINMNGGAPPPNPVVAMVLQGIVYKMWEQEGAIVDWIVSKLPGGVDVARAMAGLSLGAAEEPAAEVRTLPHSTRLPWNAHLNARARITRNPRNTFSPFNAAQLGKKTPRVEK